MASSPTARITFRVVLAVLVILVLFYMGRPLYWKISATIQEVRENKRTVKQGISQIVYEAQKSVGWFHDESDSGGRGDRKATNRRRMLFKRPVRMRQQRIGPTPSSEARHRHSKADIRARIETLDLNVYICMDKEQNRKPLGQFSPDLIELDSHLELQ